MASTYVNEIALMAADKCCGMDGEWIKNQNLGQKLEHVE